MSGNTDVYCYHPQPDETTPAGCEQLPSTLVYLTRQVYLLVLESQLPHKSVNLSCSITYIKDESTDQGRCPPLLGHRVLRAPAIASRRAFTMNTRAQ